MPGLRAFYYVAIADWTENHTLIVYLFLRWFIVFLVQWNLLNPGRSPFLAVQMNSLIRNATQLVDSGVVNAILLRVIVALPAFEISFTPMMQQWMHGAKR